MYKTTLCCYKSNGCIILVMYSITSNTIHNKNENVTNNIYLAVVQCKQCFLRNKNACLNAHRSTSVCQWTSSLMKHSNQME